MAILDLLKPKPKVFFTGSERSDIVSAIKAAEKNTSGEIRVFVESKCRYLDAVDRAKEVFFYLKMDDTKHRNASLVYIALKDKQMAVFGDDGIHAHIGDAFWNATIKKMKLHFKKDNIPQGIIASVEDIGEALKAYFPFDGENDINELPDNIVFGS